MNTTIVGSLWGDEGKGRTVDLFGETADVVVRYQGGDNAGHTVAHDGEEYKLRLVPSGVVRGRAGVLGSGCVAPTGRRPSSTPTRGASRSACPSTTRFSSPS